MLLLNWRLLTKRFCRKWLQQPLRNAAKCCATISRVCLMIPRWPNLASIRSRVQKTCLVSDYVRAANWLVEKKRRRKGTPCTA